MSATAALVDLPTVLDPAALMSSVQEALPPEIRDAVSNWVFERVLEGLEATELAIADAEPEGYARHRQSYAVGRQITERARNGYQWWMGEKWAGIAAAILGHSVAPNTHAHRALCHNALSAVVRAHEVFEARMVGNYGHAPLPASAPTAPTAAPAMVTTETIAAVPKPRATPVHAKAPESVEQPDKEECGKSETGDRETAVTAVAAPSNASEAAASAGQVKKAGEKTELDEAFETALRYKTKQDWKNVKTPEQARRSLSWFREVTGVTTKSDLTREQVLKFREFLCEVPSFVGRSIYRKGMTVQQQVALAKKMDDLKARAARGDRAAKRQIAERLTGKTSIEDVTRRLSLKTINRYLSQLGQIFEKPLDERGDRMEEHPAFRAVQFHVDKGKKGQVNPTRTLSESDLEAVFRTKLFQKEFRQKSDRFWGLMLAGFAGARRGEIAQLNPDDFDFSERVPTIRLEHATKHLKTEAAERTLPIHPALLELGLEDAVRSAAKRKQEEFLPTFKWKDSEQESGRDLTRWFIDVLEEAGVKAPGKSLKSLRKTFNTDLTRNGWNDAGRHYLMGHEHEGVNLEHYFGGFRPKDLMKFIQGTSFEDVVRRQLLPARHACNKVVPLAAAA